MNEVVVRKIGLASQAGEFDVVVKHGRIATINPHNPGDEQEPLHGVVEIDAEGSLLLPGLCDLQVRLGQPGFEERENIAKATAAARHGGITRVLAMPDSAPAIDSPAMLRSVIDVAKANANCHVHFAGSITKANQGQEMASVAGMRELGVKVLSDGVNVTDNLLLLRRCMQYSQPFGMTFAMRGDLLAFSRGSVAHEGRVAWDLGLPSSPSFAEEAGLGLVARLAHDTGVRLLVQNVSSRGSVEVIRTWKQRGADIVASVSLAHLIFDESHIGDYDTNMKVVPPLRERADVECLQQALADGTLDVIVSDHTPVTSFEKRQDYISAPAGMANLDAFLPALYHHLVKPGIIGWPRLLELCSHNPRAVLGLEPLNLQVGCSAEMLVFNPQGRTHFDCVNWKSKAFNSPFVGCVLDGKVGYSWLGQR